MTTRKREDGTEMVYFINRLVKAYQRLNRDMEAIVKILGGEVDKK
ncbi:MAG: hypothetical protein ACFFD4_04475 [Candidatus Odinarchaeota archaeon]